MKTANRISASVIILICLLMFQQATQIQDMAYHLSSNRTFPYMTIGFVLLLAVSLLVTTFVSGPTTAFANGYWKRVIGGKRLIVLGSFCIYLFVLPIVGFLPTSAAFIVLMTVFLSPRIRHDLPAALAIAVGVVGVCYVVFVYWLQFYLP
jgi:hypothetical protein